MHALDDLAVAGDVVAARRRSRHRAKQSAGDVFQYVRVQVGVPLATVSPWLCAGVGLGLAAPSAMASANGEHYVNTTRG